MYLAGNVYTDTDNILEDRPEGKSSSGEKLQTEHSDEVPKKMKKCEDKEFVLHSGSSRRRNTKVFILLDFFVYYPVSPGIFD